MKQSVGLRPLWVLGYTAALTCAAFAATNFFTNGGFEGASPFADWPIRANVQIRSFPNSIAPGQTGSNVAEVAAAGGTMTSITYNPGPGSPVMALRISYARSPELNTASSKPITGANTASIEIVRDDPVNPPRVERILNHYQDQDVKPNDNGVSSPSNLRWRTVTLYFRTNGGPNTLTIRGRPLAGTPAGRGMLIDGLQLYVLSPN
jgi:hypothetical protein